MTAYQGTRIVQKRRERIAQGGITPVARRDTGIAHQPIASDPGDGRAAEEKPAREET